MTAARNLATALHAYLEATDADVPADRSPHLQDLCTALSHEIAELVATETDERLSLDGVAPQRTPMRTPDEVGFSGAALLLGGPESSRPVEATLRAYPGRSTLRLPPHVFRFALPAVLTEAQDREWVRTGIVELRQLLFWTWDPLGVHDGFPRTADEYDAIADGLLSELHRGTPVPKLTGWLRLAETELVGDAPTPAVQRELLAERVDRWYDDSRSYWLDQQPRPTA